MLLTDYLRDALRALDVSTAETGLLHKLGRDVYDASCDLQGFEDCSDGSLGELQVKLLLDLDKGLSGLRYAIHALNRVPGDKFRRRDVEIEKCRLIAALTSVLAVDDELDARLNFDAAEKV